MERRYHIRRVQPWTEVTEEECRKAAEEAGYSRDDDHAPWTGFSNGTIMGRNSCR